MSGTQPTLRTGLRSIERVARRIRHSRRLQGLDRMWAALRPTYDKALSLAGRGAVRRVINGDTPIELGVEHRNTPEAWEPKVWRHLMSRLRPGDVFVDVGAHIGLYALGAAQRVGPTGRVFAFEADPANARDLRRHVALNGHGDIISVIDRAVGDHVGEVAFSAAASLESTVSYADNANATSVAITTLDDWFSGARIDLLKIDVEGYEAHVLRGAKDLLTDGDRAPAYVYVEMHPYAWPAFNTSFDEIRSMLEEARYAIRDIEDNPVDAVSSWSEVVAHRSSAQL